MGYLEDVLGPGGVLSKAIPGFVVREGQLELAREIDRAFKDSANLLAEAPTGTGKSVAYSVPAVYAAVGAAFGGSKVCIATANIALQEQLCGKDLPMLAQILPWPFRFALAKGRANYLCLSRSDDVAAEMVMAGSPEERAEWGRIQAWSEGTMTGDLSELTFEVTPDLRRRLTVTADECVGKSCERHGDCYANRAYRALPDANLVVTNYHLLLAHLVVLRATNGEAGILPSFDLLVCDEVHKLADIARDFLGFRVTPGSVRWAARMLAGAKGKRALDPIDPDLKRRLDAEAERFGTFLRATCRSPDYKARLRDPLREDGWRHVVELLREAGKLYLQTAAQRALPSGRKVEIIKQGIRAQLIADQIEEAVTVSKSDRNVYFIEEDDRGRVALACKPISVADDLRAMLFGGAPQAPVPARVREVRATIADSAGPGAYSAANGFQDADEEDASESAEDAPPPRRAVRSVVGTSATIRTGSSFSFCKKELGAESARELVAESPFDHYEQSIICFPADMPDPRDRSYTEAVAGAFAEVVGLAQGRTLGLFTSYRALAVAHERVVREHGHRFRIMRQGEAPRTQLVKAFREDVSSVLLGTESFWQGVDVPGEALSVVFIDKLPFAPPDDPVLDAVQDADPKGWFAHYSVPRAVIAFRQGAGRLIRSISDRGVIVCCDPRVLGKGYGKTFLRSLPEMRVSQKLSDVALFLGQKGKAPAPAREEPRGPSTAPASAPRAIPGGRRHRLRAEGGEPSHVGECEVCGSTNASILEACQGPRAAEPFAREVDEGLRAIVGGAGRRRRSQAKEG